ncbi:MAG: WD40 repeat domain-containing serine/threonine-protein kinase [Candidatus Sumerlaeia bacterium]|nr:WD40 repeat domain-containing serine/threonine-protein kinase [Candidatus Sumerlaeia bacterium]
MDNIERAPPSLENIPVPGDLPHDSLVSYNPHKSRFTPRGGTGDGPETGIAEHLETEAIPAQSPVPQWPDDDSAETHSPPPDLPVAPEVAEQPGAPPKSARRHRLVRLIGRGGCGEVWEAVQIELDRPVAVKTLRGDRMAECSSPEERAILVRNFREEALVSARLDHPNIVPVYDYGTGQGASPELSMKLVRGRQWDRLLKEERPQLSFDDFLARHLPVLSDVANAVAFAHSRGIVHRDIKPSQVMVGDFGEVLLMDWGLAMVLSDDGGAAAAVDDEQPSWFSLPTRANASSPAGTPAYMAPEQTRGQATGVGVWTDVYLLGGSLYYVLTGVAPHESAQSHQAFMRAAVGDVEDPRTLFPRAGIPDDLAELALASLAADPAARLASAEEFVRRLDDWVSGASRRRESQQITRRLAGEAAAMRGTYSAHEAFLNEAHRAAGLWPANPETPPLRREALAAYAELALGKGDLLLALTQAEQLDDALAQGDLYRRIEAAKQQRLRTRRALRYSVAAVAMLLATVLVGGGLSLRRINRERNEAVTQKNIATGALSAAETARVEAERQRAKAGDEQLYAQIRYATSLVDAGRHELARDVLWSIPEEARDWEWAYLLDRSHQTLAEFPFPVTEVSAGGSYFYSDLGDGTVRVRDTMAGALVADLDCDTTSVMILAAPEDTHIDIVAGTRLLRFAPPEWKRQIVAELPAPPMHSRRTYGDGNIAMLYPDGSAAVHEATTGKLRFATPPVPLEPLAIDGDDHSDRLLVAYKTFFRIHRLSDGSEETSISAWTNAVYSAGLSNEGHSIAIQSGDATQLYDLDRNAHFQTYLLGTRMHTHPRANTLIIGPMLASAHNAEWRGLLPVGRAEATRAKYVHPAFACYWGGANGEAGVIAADLRQVAELRGFPGQVANMWATITDIPERVDRVFSTTTDGSTQVWPGTPLKSIADLPGQWSSFREDGRFAVSIGTFDARITDIESGSAFRRVGRLFSLYRGIHIAEERDRILTFGYARAFGDCFGWEVRTHKTGEHLRWVKVGEKPSTLPYLWNTSPDDGRAVLFWEAGGPGLILDTEDGALAGTIPPTAAPATAMHFTKAHTAIVGHNDGVLVETELADGRERRRLDTGAPVWALRLHSAERRLYVSGGDRRVRAYSWGAEAPVLLRELPAGDQPAVLLDLSEDGSRLLALTDANEVVVWSTADGAELLRFRIDSAVHRIQLNQEGTRIFGLGDGTLGVWDMQGREVARVKDAIDVSLKSRRLILRTSVARMSRDVVIELPPHRAEDFPGDAGMPLQDRFELWRREQHRNWWRRKAVEAAPSSIPAVRASLRGTVAQNGRQLIGDLDSMVLDLVGRVRHENPALGELFQKMGALYTAEPDHDWHHFANGYWDNIPDSEFDPEPTHSLLRAAAPYTELRAMKQAETFSRQPFEHAPWARGSYATQLEVLGHPELARALLRRSSALMSTQGYYENRPSQLRRLRMGAADIPKPPEKIKVRPGTGFDYVRNGSLGDYLDLAPEGRSPEAHEAARNAIFEQMQKDILDWVDEVAPMPDFTAAKAAAKAKFPPPPPGDLPLTEFMGDVLDRLERGQLGGMTRDEAIEEASRRFDESVAKAEAERAVQE